MNLRHNCTLKDESDSYLPELPQNASFMDKFCRQICYLMVVSPSNPQCKNYFRSKASIVAERRRHADLNLLYIIHPFSVFRTYWEIIMMVVLLLVLIFYPVDVAFTNPNQKEINSFSLFVLVLDVVCLLDIFLTFMTGYGISTTKEVVLEPRKIFTNYFFGKYFLIDLVSSLPLELFEYQDGKWRIVGAVELLKIFRFRTFLLYMRRTADIWELNLLAFLTLRYLIVFLLLIHWTACMHYAIPNFVSFLQGGEHNERSWIIDSGVYYDPKTVYKYIRCVFRACCYLLCIGHGLQEVVTVEDYVMGILTFVIGYLFLAVLLVLTLQIVSSVMSAETKYQEIINQVKEYMGNKQLPSIMQERLISYYEYRFRKSYFREDIISAALSDRLRREINVHCYRKLVDSVSIFKDMHHHTVADIVNSLKAEIFLPNDIIVKAGSIGDCMYFLSSGTVCVVTPTGKEVCHLYDGAYFGEVALVMKDQKRIANVIAIEICEVYKLDRSSFKKCFGVNTDLYKKMELVAQDRREKTLMLEELHKKYILALEQTTIWSSAP